VNHLAYYREHNISPVLYEGTREEHFERRASLYRSLRLPPLAFRGAKVLEVASGTGQNAEYLASLNPALLELIEPYPARWTAQIPVNVLTIEQYKAPHPFDILICENWIGVRELPLLSKLASMVAASGVLVLTCVHPLGIYPNVLRRKLAARLVTDDMNFQEQTAILVRAFETHLATIKDMTRSAKDWVQDMLLNPAVEHIGVTFPTLISKLGAQFAILGTSPEFITDWRWFKSLHGNARRFNDHALSAYQFHEKEFSNYLDSDSAPGIAEAEKLLCAQTISADEVRNMGPFKSLFGRETIYASFQRV
jgi:hypothetical protein